MRAIQRIMVAVLALMLGMSLPAAADQGKGGGNDRPTVVPAVKIQGETGGELLGDYYAQNLALPNQESPFGGNANLCLDLGHRGKVLAPAGGIVEANGNIEMTCTVEVGRPVLLVATSADCSSAEADPFFGRNKVEQRACVVKFLKKTIDVTSLTVSVDGAAPVEIAKPQFFAVSPQRRVVFDDDPVFGATPGKATFVAAAWIAEIRGLRPGKHVVVEVPTITGFDLPPFVVQFNVVDRGHHDR